VILDLGDRRKRYFDDLAVGAFYLHTWSGECLGGLHASDNAPHALAVNRYDLNIVFPVERLKGRKCFSDFHVYLFSEARLGIQTFPIRLEILHRKTADVYVAYNISKIRANSRPHECNWKASFGV
jgi:hypothetical protein